MSEIRQLVVSLTMDTDNAQQNLRGLSNAVRQANADFAAAGAGVKGFENTTAGMKAKVQQLTATLNAQKQTAATYAAEVDKAGKKLLDAKGKQEGLAQALRAAESAYKASKDATGENSEETQRLARELDKAKGAVLQNERAMKSAAKAVETNTLKQTEANAKIKETEKALEGATKRLDQFGGKWKDVMRKAADGAKAFSDQAVKMGKGLTQKLTMPIVGLGAAGSKAAIDWDTAWVGVKKTVDGTDTQMAELEKSLMGLGSELPSTLTEIAGVAEAAGQLGIETGNITDFTRVMLNLGNATNLTANEAATAAAQFANIYKMSQDDFDRWGSAVVDLGNNYATTERDIVEMSMRLAAAGKQAKMSEASTLALAAAMSSLGIEADGGGSAMSKVMMDMGIAVDKGGKQLSAFAKVSGLSAKEFKAQWESDPAKAIDSFIQGLGRIEQSGGNVALTLQNMGYNERRLLDVLQRLTGAGDIFSRTLATSNNAWRDNIALTREAEQRNNSLAGILQRTKNRITVAAVEIGNKLTPWIEKAANSVAGLVEGFRNLDPGIQATILKVVGIAAAIGPLILIVGKLAAAFSSIAVLFAGPAAPFILAAAAIAGLGIALANAKSPADNLRNALKNITFKVSDVETSRITTGIEEGIAAAKKEHDIIVTVTAEMGEISDTVDEAMENGSMSRREANSIKKQLNKLIKADIDEAQKELQTSVDAYKATLLSLKDESGKPLLSEDEAASMVAAYESKTKEYIAELEGYQAQYNALLTTVSNLGKGATAEQMAELDALLQKIADVRIKIKAAQDDAIQASKAAYTLASQGRGDGRTFGQAVGYLDTKYTLEAADIKDRESKDLAIMQAQLDNMTAGSAEYEQQVALIAARSKMATEELLAAEQRLNEGMTALLTGAANRTGATETLAEIKALLDSVELATGLEKSLSDLISGNVESVPDAIEGLKEKLKTALDTMDLPEDTKIRLQDFINTDTSQISGQELIDLQYAVDGVAENLQGPLQTAIDSLSGNLDFNSAMQALFDNWDSTQLDTSNAKAQLDAILAKLFPNGLPGPDKPGDVPAPTVDAVSGADASAAAEAAAEKVYDPNVFIAKAKAAALLGIGAVGEELGAADLTQASKDLADAIDTTAMADKGKEGSQVFVDEVEYGVRGGTFGLQESSGEAGDAMVDGLIEKIDAGEAKVVAAGKRMARAALRGLFDEAMIRSPSKKSMWAGQMMVEGMAKALSGGLPMLSKLGAQMGAVSIPNAIPVMAGGGHISRTLNANTTLTVQNMNMNGNLDAQALSAQLEGERRRRIAGYGAVLRRG